MACLTMQVITLSEIPRERHCDISGSGHSIPSGPIAMAPAGAEKFAAKVKWLRGELFSVAFQKSIVTVRHHNPERLIAALNSEKFIEVNYIPRYELLSVVIKRAHIPLRFYMTSGDLEPCTLGSYVWKVRTRKKPDDLVDDWE